MSNGPKCDNRRLSLLVADSGADYGGNPGSTQTGQIVAGWFIRGISTIVNLSLFLLLSPVTFDSCTKMAPFFFIIDWHVTRNIFSNLSESLELSINLRREGGLL